MVFDQLSRHDLASLVSGDLAGHLDVGQTDLDRSDGSGGTGPDDPEVDGAAGLGPGVAGIGLHHGGGVVEIERHHPVGPALVEVDRAGMDNLGGTGTVDRADHHPVGVGDRDLPGRPRTQAGRLRRVAPPGPHRPRPGSVGADPQGVIDHQTSHPFGELFTPPTFVVVAERVFVGGAAQVGIENVGVGRVDDRRFGPTLEQFVGVAEEVVVELVLAGDHHRQRRLALTSGPTDLLPHGGDGAGETVEQHGIQASDVDAELQR